MKDPIRIWEFHEAPQEFQDLSPHGGDEDWVAHVPHGYDTPRFLESGTEFGCCDVSQHILPDGSQVRIGAHS